MKKQKILSLIMGTGVGVIVLFLLASCNTEDEFNPDRVREFSIPSAITSATYSIKVALPEPYDATGSKYAALYVLDGEENFDFVANHCHALSVRYAVDNVLVISIGYGRDREMDYTPTKISATTGGGDQFLAFIEHELIPRVEQEFNADTTRNSRVILGHSYGGLFGAYAMAVDNSLFGNYLLLSPSLWFDNEVSLLLEKQNRSKNKDENQLVFLGIGELENAGRMQAPFEAFYQTLRDNYAATRLSKNREHDLDHMGSKNPNILRGLDFYFQNR